MDRLDCDSHVEGWFEGRALLGDFTSEDDLDADNKPGIRCYHWLVAFIFGLFGRDIEKWETATEVVYLDYVNLRAWVDRHRSETPVDQRLPLVDQVSWIVREHSRTKKRSQLPNGHPFLAPGEQQYRISLIPTSSRPSPTASPTDHPSPDRIALQIHVPNGKPSQIVLHINTNANITQLEQELRDRLFASRAFAVQLIHNGTVLDKTWKILSDMKLKASDEIVVKVCKLGEQATSKQEQNGSEPPPKALPKAREQDPPKTLPKADEQDPPKAVPKAGEQDRSKAKQEEEVKRKAERPLPRILSRNSTADDLFEMIVTQAEDAPQYYELFLTDSKSEKTRTRIGNGCQLASLKSMLRETLRVPTSLRIALCKGEKEFSDDTAVLGKLFQPNDKIRVTIRRAKPDEPLEVCPVMRMMMRSASSSR